MKWLNRIFDFYLDASVHVAFSVFSLLHISCYLLHVSLNVHLSYFLFFSTIACYNFIKYGVEAEKYILVANQYHKNIQFASFIALGFALYHAYFLPFQLWKALGLLLVLTGLYALPLLPKAKSLRSWGGLKIFMVGLVWAGTTVILPVIVSKHGLGWDVWVETFQRVVLVLILLMPFEIRDLQYDMPELRTIPQRYGVVQTKIFGGLAVMLFFFSTFLKDNLSMLEIVSKGLLCLILGMALVVVKTKQNKYFTSFWVEAIPIFWWGIIWGLFTQF